MLVCQPARWDSVTEEERGREGFRLCSKQGMQRGADTAAQDRTKSEDNHCTGQKQDEGQAPRFGPQSFPSAFLSQAHGGNQEPGWSTPKVETRLTSALVL